MREAPSAALGDLRGVLLEGRYRVTEAIAQGGMSTVYSGLDTRLDRRVAIKIMDPRLAADQAFRRRFEREARAAARLDHPGVVGVHDQGTHGDGPEPLVFLVMELVDGGTLRDVLAERRALPVPEAFAVLEPVLAGLASAHRDGLVHRDVKPENVLISQTGVVKVADFGLVTAAAQTGMTSTGTILGTPAYLAPEQVASGNTDARTDVYAAGVVLYEMLTGAPPYSGDSAISVAYQHVNNDVPAPSARAPGIPPAVDDLVALATARDAAARPLDAGDFALAVRRVRAELRIPPARIPTPPPLPPAERSTERIEAAAPANPSAGRWGTRMFTNVPEPATAAPHPGVADRYPNRRRSRRTFAIWITIVLALALAIASAAWWLGAGRWTAMPPLVGQDRPTAERMLADAALVANVTEARDSTAPAGTVTASEPEAGAALLRGDTVTITVSAGRPQVPRISAGTSVAEAQRLIREAGLRPVVDRDRLEFSDSVALGAVLRTDPPAGTRLAIDAPVTLIVSAGDLPRQIPGRVGDFLDGILGGR